jgi:hypothetical protein
MPLRKRTTRASALGLIVGLYRSSRSCADRPRDRSAGCSLGLGGALRLSQTERTPSGLHRRRSRYGSGSATRACAGPPVAGLAVLVPS